MWLIPHLPIFFSLAKTGWCLRPSDQTKRNFTVWGGTQHIKSKLLWAFTDILSIKSPIGCVRQIYSGHVVLRTFERKRRQAKVRHVPAGNKGWGSLTSSFSLTKVMGWAKLAANWCHTIVVYYTRGLHYTPANTWVGKAIEGSPSPISTHPPLPLLAALPFFVQGRLKTSCSHWNVTEHDI